MGFRITSSKKIERKIGLNMNDIIGKKILESAEIIEKSINLSQKISDAVDEIYNSLKNGNYLDEPHISQ